MTMKKYTKRKPDIVRAIQFTGENAYEILRELCGSGDIFYTMLRRKDKENVRRVRTLMISSEYGECEALEGDYIAQTMSGKLIAYNESVFLEIYKEIE